MNKMSGLSLTGRGRGEGEVGGRRERGQVSRESRLFRNSWREEMNPENGWDQCPKKTRSKAGLLDNYRNNGAHIFFIRLKVQL